MAPPRKRSPRHSSKSGSSILDELPPPPRESDDTETLEFLKAIDLFKRTTGKNFPSWTDVLEIIRSLGYRKVSPPGHR
ncbi:MAG: hypothetical protein V2A76_13040 [Planctomycetota bacterium]